MSLTFEAIDKALFKPAKILSSNSAAPSLTKPSQSDLYLNHSNPKKSLKYVARHDNLHLLLRSYLEKECAHPQLKRQAPVQITSQLDSYQCHKHSYLTSEVEVHHALRAVGVTVSECANAILNINVDGSADSINMEFTSDVAAFAKTDLLLINNIVSQDGNLVARIPLACVEAKYGYTKMIDGSLIYGSSLLRGLDDITREKPILSFTPLQVRNLALRSETVSSLLFI